MGVTWLGSVLVGPHHVRTILFSFLRQIHPGARHLENQQPLRRIADLRSKVDAFLCSSAVLPRLIFRCHWKHPIRIRIHLTPTARSASLKGVFVWRSNRSSPGASRDPGTPATM